MKKNILIVEDNSIIAEDLKEIIEEVGHHVVAAVETVSQAKEYIATIKLDLVFIDIDLGDSEEDGICLGKYLLIKDNIPYIYVTGAYSQEIIERVKDTRPYGYLIKPYKKADIVASMTIVLNNFVVRNVDIQRKNITIDSEVPYILKKAVEYIDNNILEKIDINDVVARTKWSYFHFLRIFKQYVGLSPYQYVLKKKIEKAQSLLIETDLPICQIAYKLGFDSHSTFTTTFRKMVGNTPEQFRTKKSIEHRFYNG